MALLLEKGAEVDLPDNHGGTPLSVSALIGNVACVRLLLEAGADPLQGFSLEVAIMQNNTDVAALLQARIAEMQDDVGDTEGEDEDEDPDETASETTESEDEDGDEEIIPSPSSRTLCSLQ